MLLRKLSFSPAVIVDNTNTDPDRHKGPEAAVVMLRCTDCWALSSQDCWFVSQAEPIIQPVQDSLVDKSLFHSICFTDNNLLLRTIHCCSTWTMCFSNQFYLVLSCFQQLSFCFSPSFFQVFICCCAVFYETHHISFLKTLASCNWSALFTLHSE